MKYLSQCLAILKQAMFLLRRLQQHYAADTAVLLFRQPVAQCQSAIVVYRQLRRLEQLNNISKKAAQNIVAPLSAFNSTPCENRPRRLDDGWRTSIWRRLFFSHCCRKIRNRKSQSRLRTPTAVVFWLFQTERRKLLLFSLQRAAPDHAARQENVLAVKC